MCCKYNKMAKESYFKYILTLHYITRVFQNIFQNKKCIPTTMKYIKIFNVTSKYLQNSQHCISVFLLCMDMNMTEKHLWFFTLGEKKTKINFCGTSSNNQDYL